MYPERRRRRLLLLAKPEVEARSPGKCMSQRRGTERERERNTRERERGRLSRGVSVKGNEANDEEERGRSAFESREGYLYY